MEILSGTLFSFDPVIEIEGNESIAVMGMWPGSRKNYIYVAIDFGRKGKCGVYAESYYIVRIKDNELCWEKIDFEDNDENSHTRKDLILLPYLKSKGIKCHYRNSNERKGETSCVDEVEAFDTIISKNGYLQRLENKSVRLDKDDFLYYMRKTYVNYKRGQLIIDGKEVKRWGFDDDMWECKGLISWVKKSFEQEQRLSIEDFMSLADQWSKDAMEELERYVSPVFIEFYDGSRFEEVTPSAKEFLKGDIITIILKNIEVI